MIACGKSAYREARWWVCAMAAERTVARASMNASRETDLGCSRTGEGSRHIKSPKGAASRASCREQAAPAARKVARKPDTALAPVASRWVMYGRA